MSADNGIYILCLKNECRVIEAQAIDNLYWNEKLHCECDSMQPEQVVNYYKNARSFPNLKQAMIYANELYDECYIVEYGICTIADFRNYTWKQVYNMSEDFAMAQILRDQEFDYDKNAEKFVNDCEQYYLDRENCDLPIIKNSSIPSRLFRGRR